MYIAFVMLQSVLFFIVYTSLFCWLITKVRFIKKTGLPYYVIISFFLVKIAAGCFYGYIHSKSPYYPDKIDTWKFYFESLPETKLLLKNPLLFFNHLFGNGYESMDKPFLQTTNNYWNDFKHNIMIGLMSVFNLLSGKNYYINIIFYNFITLFGCVAFYRFCSFYFKANYKIIFIIALCLPSFLFWGSGFHKEGLLFTALSFILYTSHRIIYHKLQFTTVFIFCSSVLFLLLIRSYLFLFLTPFLLVWIVLQYYPKLNTRIAYVCITIFFILFFFNIGNFYENVNLPKYTSNAQLEFKSLGGNTAIAVDTLYPNAKSFLHHLPTSLQNAFLQPNVKQLNLTYLPSFIENWLLLFLCLLTIFFNKRNPKNATSYLFLLFSFFGLLFIGYTVPITGAIVRYKSILTPFLLVAILQSIDWEKLLAYLPNPKKDKKIRNISLY